jgi:HK97 family phage major capsid protein
MANELELKEVKDFLEEKLGVVSSKFDEKRNEDKQAFEQKVIGAVADLKKEMQKEFDDTIVELEAKFKKNENKSVLSFEQAFKKSLEDQKDEIVSAVKNARSGQKSAIELKAFDFSDFTGYGDWATEFSSRVIERKYEAFNYRSVLGIGRMSGEFVKYPKELATVGGAGVWTHGSGAKPEIEPKLSVYTAEAEWIAGLIKEVPVAMVEDIPFMNSFLGQKSRNELMKAENLALQNGSGGISGLLQEAVLYNGSKTVFVEKLIDSAMRQIAVAGGGQFGVTAIILSNSDYTDILINKASGSGEYDLPSVVGIRPDGTLSIAGIPVYATGYLATGQGLIGDFREAQLLVRSNPVLRVFDQNADNAEKNLLLMRIEERIALAVYNQNAFVKLAAHS